MAAWVLPAVMALAGAIAGKAKSDSAKDNQKKQANLRAAEIEASPWTGMGPQTGVNFAGSEGGSILSGGLMGLGASQGVAGMGGGGEDPSAVTGAADASSGAAPSDGSSNVSFLSNNRDSGNQAPGEYFGGENPYKTEQQGPDWGTLYSNNNKPKKKSSFGNYDF